MRKQRLCAYVRHFKPFLEELESRLPPGKILGDFTLAPMIGVDTTDGGDFSEVSLLSPDGTAARARRGGLVGDLDDGGASAASHVSQAGPDGSSEENPVAGAPRADSPDTGRQGDDVFSAFASPGDEDLPFQAAASAAAGSLSRMDLGTGHGIQVAPGEGGQALSAPLSGSVSLSVPPLAGGAPSPEGTSIFSTLAGLQRRQSNETAVTAGLQPAHFAESPDDGAASTAVQGAAPVAPIGPSNNIGGLGGPLQILPQGDTVRVTEGGAGDSYTVQLSSQPTADVTVSIALAPNLSTSAASLTFTPSNWNVLQTVNVTAADDGVVNNYHTATITHTATSGDPNFNNVSMPLDVSIIDANGPSAVEDYAPTSMNTAVTINVIANDANRGVVPGTNLTVTAVTAGDQGGTVVNNGNGTVTYTPPSGFNGGDDLFSYTIRDAAGYSTSGNVLVTVPFVNRSPTIASVANQASAEGTAISLQTVASDPNGDALWYTTSGLPAGLSIDNRSGEINGTISYSAAQQGGGVYNSTVTVTDPDGASASTSFTWTVSDVNQVP